MLLKLKSINILNDCQINSKSDNKIRKIRERLKELSQLLLNLRIINIEWNPKWDALLIIFNNGIISSVHFDHNYHIIRVNHDKFLVNKLLSEYIVNIVLRDNYVLISYTQSKLTFVSLNTETANKGKRKYKISNRSPIICPIELENGTSRRVERNLIVNDSGDLVIVWWKTGTNWVAPWSAPGKNIRDLANILIYSRTKSDFKLISMSSISGDIFQISFNKWNTDQVVLLQQSSESTYVLNYCIFEINESFECLQKVYSIRIPLLRVCMKAELTSSQDKIVLLCDDDSIMLFNIEQNALYSLHSSVNAFDFSCNQFDAIFSVADQFGRVSLYDYSLNTIPINYEELLNAKMIHLKQIKFIDPTKLCLYFNEQNSADIFLITLPVLIDNKTLISEYIRSGKPDEAIAALQSINWNCYSDIAYFCLNTIFNNLIKRPLNSIRENQLERTLATFLTPIIPIDNEIREEYKLELHYLAKRLFYHLLRYNCLEKAFLLGIDLKNRQLFTLLHKIALEKGNETIANAASLKSKHYNEQCFYTNESIPIVNNCEQNNNQEVFTKKLSSIVSTSSRNVFYPNTNISDIGQSGSNVSSFKEMPIASILKPISSKAKASIIATKPVKLNSFYSSEAQLMPDIVTESLTERPEEALYSLSSKKKAINVISNAVLINDSRNRNEVMIISDKSKESSVTETKGFNRSSFSSYSTSSCSTSSSSSFRSASASTSLNISTSLMQNSISAAPELPPRTYLTKHCMKAPERPPKKLISHQNIKTVFDDNYRLGNDSEDSSVPINLSDVKSGSKIECIHFGVV